MSTSKNYEDRIRGMMSPQVYIVECFLEGLKDKIESSELDQVNYTISPKSLKKAFKEKSPKPLEPTVFGRTIKVFLDMNGLEEGSDFTKTCGGGGGSTKYHLRIKKAKELLSYLTLDKAASI